jgi:hypothetical protein
MKLTNRYKPEPQTFLLLRIRCLVQKKATQMIFSAPIVESVVLAQQ